MNRLICQNLVLKVISITGQLVQIAAVQLRLRRKTMNDITGAVPGMSNRLRDVLSGSTSVNSRFSRHSRPPASSGA
jgi:hypothetical protein